MKVVIVKPYERAKICEIEGTLSSMQKLVGGRIEAVYYFRDAVLVCNDEGKINNMPFNRMIFDDEGNLIDIIAGPFFICGQGDEDFTSLTDEQAIYYKKKFLIP